MNKKYKLVLISIVILITIISSYLFVIYSETKDGSNKDSKKYDKTIPPSAGTIAISRGTYLGQDWHIDSNHILHWNKKPYIPHSINDFPSMEPFMTEEKINEILEGIDLLLDYGINEFPLELGYLIEEYNDYILEKLEKDKLSEKDYDDLYKEMSEAISVIANHITNKGGTYVVIGSIHPLAWELTGKKMGNEDERSVSIDLMMDKKTQRLYVEYLQKFSQAVTTKGLRGFLFNWELNGQEKIKEDPKTKNFRSELERFVNTYGALIKKEIGDVPVFYGLAQTLPVVDGFVLPYLSAVCASNIDGIYMQVHGSMPKDARFHASQSLITRMLNSCTKTKFFWGYGQATPLGSFLLYRSKDLMYGHYEAMVDVGMTGFMYDQISSFGFVELGMPYETEKMRNQNKKWWGETGPMIKNKILEYSKINNFSTKKWDIPIKKEDLEFKVPKVLTPEEVFDIAVNDAEIKRLIDLGAEISDPYFNPDYGVWGVYIKLFGTVWIEDSKENKILLNEVKLVGDARDAGYPIPNDKWIINFLPNGNDEEN